MEANDFAILLLAKNLLFEEDKTERCYLNALIRSSSLYAATCRENTPKVANYIELTVPRYLCDNFKTFFRMTRGTFERVLQCVSGIDTLQRRIGSGGREQIPLEKDLLMTLWYLGSQETVRSIADRFDVSKSTFLYHNRQMLSAICESLLNAVICWPKHFEKQAVIDAFEEKRGFQASWVLYNEVGTHIRISCPLTRHQDYINRKGYYSITLQAVCRDDKRFTDVFCGWSGRVHDARVFRNSPVFETLPELTGMNHLLGDGAYPISTHLVTPYRDNGHLTREQINFNKALSGTRVAIENAFGMLKSRFRRLQKIAMVDLEYIVKTVIASCILHNLCVLNDDEIDVILEDDQQENDVNNAFNLNQNNVEGVLQRAMITRQLARN